MKRDGATLLGMMVLVALACASEPDSPAVGTCASFCERMLAVACPNDTAGACVATCEETHAGAGKAFWGDSDRFVLRDCRFECDGLFDQACYDACNAKYASVHAHSDALVACRESRCSC